MTCLLKRPSPTNRQLSMEDADKVAMIYSLTRGDAALAKFSKDEIAEMIAANSLKGQITCSSGSHANTHKP